MGVPLIFGHFWMPRPRPLGPRVWAGPDLSRIILQIAHVLLLCLSILALANFNWLGVCFLKKLSRLHNLCDFVTPLTPEILYGENLVYLWIVIFSHRIMF